MAFVSKLAKRNDNDNLVIAVRDYLWSVSVRTRQVDCVFDSNSRSRRIVLRLFI